MYEPDSPFDGIEGPYERRDDTRYARPERVYDDSTRAPLVLGSICAVLLVISIASEYRFWWLTIAGQNATGVVVDRREVIIGWGGRGRPFPITETQFTVHFESEGKLAIATVRVPWSSQVFKPGDSVELMYFPDAPQAARPASWGFYANHDSMWQIMAISDCVCILVLIVCAGLHFSMNHAPNTDNSGAVVA